MKQTALWIWFVMIMGIANHIAPKLVKNYPDIQELCALLKDPKSNLVRDEAQKRVKNITIEQAENIVQLCEKKGIHIMTWEDDNYPEILRHIIPSPLVLFCKGNPDLLKQNKKVSVVGTRNPSNYSMRIANKLCNELAEKDILLVSGSAVGLDAIAHQAAVFHHQPTIAVLGCGADYPYPKQNLALKTQIIQSGGLLVTEYFPGTPPYASNFPVRNRILSGISETLLIMEAGKESGCMITANLACEQGKNVFCIPPADIFDPRYAGQIALLRDGAFPVFSSQDILDSLKLPDSCDDFDPDDEIPDLEEKFVALLSLPKEATPEQIKILQLLQEGDKTVNMLCALTQMRFESLTNIIVDMEINGWIVNMGGDTYTITEAFRKK